LKKACLWAGFSGIKKVTPAKAGAQWGYGMKRGKTQPVTAYKLYI